MRNETVTLEVTMGKQTFSTTYEKLIWDTPDDVIQALSNGDKEPALVLDKINMAEDWKRRTKARLEFTKEDDEVSKAKSIEDQVKAYINTRQKMGKPVTEADARKRVLAMMEE